MSRHFEVLLHDQPAGFLAASDEGEVSFRFLDSYLELAERPVLGQKFEDDLGKVYRNRRGQGLPDFFANLIPEGKLRAVITQQAGIEPEDDLALLAFVGQDLPGAVVLRPTEETATRFRDHEAEPADLGDGENQEEPALRFSLAGVQLKFSMLRGGERLSLPAKSEAGEWIVKFYSPVYPNLPENEFSMLSWARAARFDVPEFHLHDIEDVQGFPRRLGAPGTRVLAIRRFDREAGRRIHQEDLAQVVGLPPQKKYEQITYEALARLVQRLIDGEAAHEFARRLVFVIACGNNDAHLKNWSLTYPDRINPRWSPLYDQVATIAWSEPDRRLALKLAGVKEFSRIDSGTLELFATRAQLSPARILDEATELLKNLRQHWREISPNLPLPAAHRAALAAHWRSVPLLRRAGLLE